MICCHLSIQFFRNRIVFMEQNVKTIFTSLSEVKLANKRCSAPALLHGVIPNCIKSLSICFFSYNLNSHFFDDYVTSCKTKNFNFLP